MKKKNVLNLLLCLGLSSGVFAKNKKDENIFHPTLTVPKLSVKPTLDGKIEPGEWKDAAAVTGVGTGGLLMGAKGLSMVPEVQQVIWYLGFDDNNLYLAMRSPHKKGTYPYATVKENDNMAVLFEDHVEIQILPHTQRELAGKAGKGFFKIMVNPFGTFIDQHLYNGTVGTEEVWSTGGITKCHVTDSYWDLEMSIELARLGHKGLDGKNMVIQLVRTDSCTGIYFAGLVPATWMSWRKFAEADFRSKAPVFQFLKVGEIMAGNLDSKVKIIGKGKLKDIDVKISVENAEGKLIYSEKQSVKVGEGEEKELVWQKTGIPISNTSFNTLEKNFFEIKATYKEGTKEYILYHNRTPFVKLTQEFMTKYIEPWLKGRPQSGKWNSIIAYQPYSGVAELKVDLDFLGMPQKILSARKVKVSINKKGDSKSAIESEILLDNKKGKKLLKTGKLPAGDYEACFSLIDENDQEVGSQKVEFESKEYPWMNNKLGKSGEVIPPYEPMTVKKNIISTWGADCTIGKNGLPEQIKVRMPSGNSGAIRKNVYRKKYELLAAPISVELKSDGKILKSDKTTGGISNKAMEKIEIKAEESFKGLNLQVDSFEEYDN
jgi:hypothetical protein